VRRLDSALDRTFVDAGKSGIKPPHSKSSATPTLLACISIPTLVLS